MHSYSSVSHSLASPNTSWLEVPPFPLYSKLPITDVCARFFCYLLQLSHIKQLSTDTLSLGGPMNVEVFIRLNLFLGRETLLIL